MSQPPCPPVMFENMEDANKRIVELEARVEENAKQIEEVRRRLEGRDERIGELEEQVEELDTERDELVDEVRAQRHTLAQKSESLRLCARVEDAHLKRIAELEEQVEELEEQVEDLEGERDEIERERDGLLEKLERADTHIKRMGERSRAKDAEMDELDCELAEVREHMKEMLHLYLEQNERANNIGEELLKRLKQNEKQAGDAMNKVEEAPKAPTTTTTEEVTYIGSINTESPSFKRYLASLPEDERREILQVDGATTMVDVGEGGQAHEMSLDDLYKAIKAGV